MGNANGRESQPPALAEAAAAKWSNNDPGPSRNWLRPLATSAELLRYMVMELCSPHSSQVASFISELIVALHALELDLNSPDAQGRTLLIT